MVAVIFECDVVDCGAVQRVDLRGELDILHAEQLQRALLEGAGTTVIVDLSELEFIDSSGLAALVRARTLLAARGGTCQFRGATNSVRRTFEITGLHHLLSD